ncbi:hypothetical protein [Frankia sp. AgB32]|uniref:hypothetical protein n=1 Tax=Frankia sp. AgB32 TaxID=631119 RepID=UPI00200BD826|nr:hypothetical protein [Frankia sp. AgB32]MCK9894007.1 hypothetical protein [Frankia sp. AgB32]
MRSFPAPTPASALRDEIVRARSWVLTPPWLRLALSRARAGQSRVVLHPLGFLCIPVLRTAWGGVCVHLWAEWYEAESPTTSPVHCHRWDLHSTIVAGWLCNHVLRVTPSASATHRLFEIHSSAGEDRIDMTPTLVSCSRVATTTYSRGQSYELPAGEFHLTEIREANAATIVLATRRPGQLDLSVGPIDGRSHRVRRQLCTPAQGARAAGEVARLLGCDPAASTRSARQHG